MTDYQSSSSTSSPQLQVSQELFPENLQSLKVTSEEKAGTIPGGTIVTTTVLIPRLPQDQ